MLTELKREAAGIPPSLVDVAINAEVITKIDQHRELGVDDECVAIYSDDEPRMVCFGTVSEIAEKIEDDRRRAVESVLSPLREAVEALANRVLVLEALLTELPELEVTQ